MTRIQIYRKSEVDYREWLEELEALNLDWRCRAISAGALTFVAQDRAEMKQFFIFPASRYFGVCR